MSFTTLLCSSCVKHLRCTASSFLQPLLCFTVSYHHSTWNGWQGTCPTSGCVVERYTGCNLATTAYWFIDANIYSCSEHGAVENGTPAARPWTTAAPLATHKLGPKANQGAINAGLRALDRTGKPCRKWERKGFSVKSFTGVSWQLPSWRAPKTTILKMDDDGKIASAPILNGDSKANNNSSSAMDSEKSHSGGDVDIRARTSNHASSPILGIAIPA